MEKNVNGANDAVNLNIFQTFKNWADSTRLFSSARTTESIVPSDIRQKLKEIEKKVDEQVSDEKIIESLNLSDLFDWRSQLCQMLKIHDGSNELTESIEYLDLFIELAKEKNKSLDFLDMCSNEELSSLVYWIRTEVRLDKNGTIVESPRKISSFYHYAFNGAKDNLHTVLPMIEECILMEESVKAIESRYRNLLLKVCDTFKVNYHPLTSEELLEKELLQKIWDLPFDKLTAKDIRQICLEHFRQFRFYSEWFTEYNKVIPCVLLIAAYRYKYC